MRVYVWKRKCFLKWMNGPWVALVWGEVEWREDWISIRPPVPKVPEEPHKLTHAANRKQVTHLKTSLRCALNGSAGL